MRHWLILICLLALALPLGAPLSLRTIEVSAAPQQEDTLETFQGYLDDAPLGMGIRYAWTLEGGRGENVRIVDIEFNWNLEHNDLLAATSDLFVYVKGVDKLQDERINRANLDHGTAVAGLLVAESNGVGVTGIAHKAKLGLINPLTDGNVLKVADAIRLAASRMEPGDVIVLEQQSIAGPRLDITNGRGLLPIEFDPFVFDAIKEATAKGIVVVESAGNGFENLDDAVYQSSFNRNQKDSGAIIVGAGHPEGGVYGPGPDRSRTEESNYGSRVDVQGWGRFVVTTGYGNLRNEQGENNWYTDVFGATSAATAMVAGAAAVLQSIIKERGMEPLTSQEMRQLLVTTGTPQAGDTSQHIGPRPNLQAAIAALDSTEENPDPKIESVRLKGLNKFLVDGKNFMTRDSVIEVNGQALRKMKYPLEFGLPSGTTTRVVAKGDMSEVLPLGVEVTVTVYTPSSNKRSNAVVFKRE